MVGLTKKNCKAYAIILLMGLVSALFSTIPFVSHLEEEYGLTWLFYLRQTATPAKEVVIVTLDRASAEILHLPDDPEKWPRSYYAQLIRNINQNKPSVIGINITFNESRNPINDRLLAEAIAENKNVILTNYLKRSYFSPSSNAVFASQSVTKPIPIIERAAINSAPFPLSKTAAKVKQFWTYTSNEGDVATFPVEIFQLFLFNQAYPEILEIMNQLGLAEGLPNPFSFKLPDDWFNAIKAIKLVKATLLNTPDKLNQFDLLLDDAEFSQQKKNMLHSMVRLLKTPNALYFNHYGVAGTITSIPFYQTLANDFFKPDNFANKVILIGYSDDIEPEKNQGIYTVFSKNYGSTTSPIEIAATAVANLIDNSWLRRLNYWEQCFLLSGWGLILGSAWCLISFRRSVITLFCLSFGYMAIAYMMFTKFNIWMPFFIPIMLQMPLILLISSILYFLKTRQQRKQIHNAFVHYIPNDVVDNISSQKDIKELSRYGQVLEGLCMTSDAEQYTTLSEKMNSEALNNLMNEYYGVMFPIVEKFDGIISDVVGDAMMAIWARPERNNRIKQDACYVALKIQLAINEFNQSQPFRLPTRLGLHYGEIRLGNVGAHNHYEYRAIGDTVNTSARIENLNKLLGTKILISGTVIENLVGFITREMGYFVLRGKTKPVLVYELIAEVNEQPFQDEKLLEGFSEALQLFQKYQWEAALKLWKQILLEYPNDGGTLFYTNYLLKQAHFPSSSSHDLLAMVNLDMLD